MSPTVRLHRPAALPPGGRTAVRAAVLLGLALGAWAPAHSVVTNACCFGGTRDVVLRIGSVGTTIDVVRFDVGAGTTGNALPLAPNPHGNGVGVDATTGAVPVSLRVRAPAAQVPQAITVTISAPANLTCSSGCGAATIPFSEIGWTVRDVGAGDFQSGTFGTTTTLLTGNLTGFLQFFLGGTYTASNELTFTFANSAAYMAGRYVGRVSYTVTLP